MVSDNTFDVVIVGAGPAAWSAATFLARANVTTLVIGDSAQSGLADAAEVWNYAGFPKGISGRELLEQMREGAVRQGAQFIKGEIVHLERHVPRATHQIQHEAMSARRDAPAEFFVRTAERQEFYAGNLLLAHGANFIKVNLEGEVELVGNGLHYCALCDGPHYKGKDVIVLGNSNLAAEEALQLQIMGAKPRIITHAIEANITSEYQKLLDAQNISVSVGKAEKIQPKITLTVREKDGAVRSHSTDGLFIALGVASSSTFAQKLGLAMNGNFLKADENGRTNVNGVWVAGLARGGVNQVAKSVGEGTVAAVDMIKSIKGLPQYLDHT